jgi:hypothetical protein
MVGGIMVGGNQYNPYSRPYIVLCRSILSPFLKLIRFKRLLTNTRFSLSVYILTRLSHLYLPDLHPGPLLSSRPHHEEYVER